MAVSSLDDDHYRTISLDCTHHFFKLFFEVIVLYFHGLFQLPTESNDSVSVSIVSDIYTSYCCLIVIKFGNVIPFSVIISF